MAAGMQQAHPRNASRACRVPAEGSDAGCQVPLAASTARISWLGSWALRKLAHSIHSRHCWEIVSMSNPSATRYTSILLAASLSTRVASRLVSLGQCRQGTSSRSGWPGGTSPRSSIVWMGRAGTHPVRDLQRKRASWLKSAKQIRPPWWRTCSGSWSRHLIGMRSRIDMHPSLLKSCDLHKQNEKSLDVFFSLPNVFFSSRILRQETVRRNNFHFFFFVLCFQGQGKGTLKTHRKSQLLFVAHLPGKCVEKYHSSCPESGQSNTLVSCNGSWRLSKQMACTSLCNHTSPGSATISSFAAVFKTDCVFGFWLWGNIYDNYLTGVGRAGNFYCTLEEATASKWWRPEATDAPRIRRIDPGSNYSPHRQDYRPDFYYFSN